MNNIRSNQANQKPLWKSGSHVKPHVTKTTSRRLLASQETSQDNFDLPTDELAEWFNANPRTEATPQLSMLPAGEVSIKTSSVFGVYNQIPQVPFNLLKTYVDNEAKAIATGKLQVRDPRNSNSLLTRVLATPVMRYQFA